MEDLLPHCKPSGRTDGPQTNALPTGFNVHSHRGAAVQRVEIDPYCASRCFSVSATTPGRPMSANRIVSGLSPERAAASRMCRFRPFALTDFDRSRGSDLDASVVEAGTKGDVCSSIR
jgi:hypothetical protein